MVSKSPYTIIGETIVTIAGTAERLFAESEIVSELTIRAKSDNGGNIFIGGNDVANINAVGIPASEGVRIRKSYGLDIRELFINAENDGDGVNFYGTYL